MNSSKANLVTALVTAVVVSILTMVASLGITRYNDQLERSRRIEQERRDVYGNLRGVQSQVESLLGASMNARVRKEFYKTMIRSLGVEVAAWSPFALVGGMKKLDGLQEHGRHLTVGKQVALTSRVAVLLGKLGRPPPPRRHPTGWAPIKRPCNPLGKTLGSRLDLLG
jgi:hypothetical protein